MVVVMVLARRVVTRRVGIEGRGSGERFGGGGTAYGKKDVVGCESEVRIAELRGELAEWRLEIG